MKIPQIVAKLANDKWTVPYIGMDGDKASQAYDDAMASGPDAAMHFVRGSVKRKFKRGAVAVLQATNDAPAPEPEQPKARKGGK